VAKRTYTSELDAVRTRTFSDPLSEQYGEHTSLRVIAENGDTLLSTKSFDALCTIEVLVAIVGKKGKILAITP